MEKFSHALILGYGRSGQAAERLLHAEGVETCVLTDETAGDSEVRRALENHPFDICIVSPGFRLSHPWLRAVRNAGIPLLSELELGWSRHKGKTIAVTGSNGKSTAVKWICDSLRQAGHTAAIGGNYGIPSCQVALEQPDLEWLVLEVSSFQLETVQAFCADVAVLLNVLPNHLDRHETMDVYRRTKARIFGPSSSAGACLVPAELQAQMQTDVGEGARRWISFGGTSEADYFFNKGQVFRGAAPVLDLAETLFDNPILGSCTGAAMAAVAGECGIPAEAVEATARNFCPLPHRLQQAGELDGVTYINDSKATNLAAVSAALQACRGKINLIAGGLPKETDYTFIKEILAERVRTIYLIGHASRAMYQAWRGVCPCVECGTLEVAFGSARDAARPGETILLSPGCASFDQFRSFEERGERFLRLFQDAVQAGGDAS
jgi:UDP-N-acetylmuramoylalanine--D-glutamate ligase